MVTTTEREVRPNATAVDYRITATHYERESAFRLVYDSYRHSGLVQGNPFAMRILPHHLLPTTEIFVAEQAGRVLSTVTLVADGELGLPMESIYPDEVGELQRQGRRVGEVSCLASRRTTPISQCLELLRLMVQTARFRGLDCLVVAVHPRHTRFYQRFLAFEQLGTETSYPAVCDHPAVALLLDFDLIDRERPANYERFFGEPLPAEQMQPRPMASDERQCFRYILRLIGNDFEAPAVKTTRVARDKYNSNWTDQLYRDGVDLSLLETVVG